jgi:succinyl-diaminopimelate desuccinylase
VTALDLSLPGPDLTVALCDVESVSGNEKALADLIEGALRDVPHLTVDRDGDAVVARTSLGRAERVVLAGHIDTVPLGGNLPCRVEGVRLAADLAQPNRDVTYVFYDHEEVEAEKNGLGRIARDHADWLAGDFAVLMEPTNATVEGGCQGTMRADVVLRGHRAHSARSWLGSNAVHAAGEVLRRLEAYDAEQVDVDGLVYREGLNAVGITGGVAGNVIPDECRVSVNYRFAPSRSEGEAADVVRRVLDGYDVEVVDSAPGALPGLSQPAAAAFVAMVGREPQPKFGWTDVARFSALGVPAVNYGPGDPGVAHQREEYCDVGPILECEERMLAWLS